MSIFLTEPLPIVDLPADTNHYGGTRFSYEFIFLHDTEGADSRAWLSTAPGSQVSCHRLIARDGTIYKIVPDEQVAWTQGRGYMGGLGYNYTLNERSLSIEFENLGTRKAEAYPVAQLTAGARQVVEWWGLYGFLPIMYHAMVDPNRRDPWAFPRNLFDALIWRELELAYEHTMRQNA